MDSDSIVSESKFSENQTTIPARIRRELDISDGDTLRWQIIDDDTLQVRIVQQRGGSFSGFDGYDGDHKTDVITGHDGFGIGI